MNSIRQTLKYMTSKRYRSELQAKQGAADFFASLPPCRVTVLIADPSYGGGEYRCSVTIPAHALLDWTKVETERTILHWQDEISWPFFLHWLSETAGAGTSPLPKQYFQSIQSEITEWVMNGDAQVWCHSCGATIADITSTDINRDNAGNGSYWWTTAWHCPAGHELYSANNEMRILRTSHRFNNG